LGNVLCELGDHRGAVRAFERALVIDPQYADGHYSLADALEELGETTTAREHWRAYLEQEAYGEWADYARSRLASRA
jgi:tetratricopeptide (TPR) repeat protein